MLPGGQIGRRSNGHLDGLAASGGQVIGNQDQVVGLAERIEAGLIADCVPPVREGKFP